MAAGVVFYSAAAGGSGRACHKNVMGYCLEFSDHEESGGSNLWPIDSLDRRLPPPSRQRRPEISRRFLEIRRNRPLQSMAVGFVCCPAAMGSPDLQIVMGYCLEFSDHEESGGSNLWPTDSPGRRLPPPSRQRRPEIFRRFLEIRRNRPLQSMAAGFVCCPAAAGGSGPCPLERLLKKITCKIKVGVIY